jgi:serine/threonine protein kinase
MDQYIGKMLDDRYEILELIGSGGMANVYKARCHRLNRLVAIKILKSDLADNADFRRRFHDESQAVAQLSHANIVSVYDVSTNPDMEYIVMELIDGITLKQYMERRGRMDWRESLHFITQIMRGLSHAHSRGIIHRDIKPQNIMVLRDGSVKVADFGIACLANQGQTLTQEALGSVHYISPEQARGDRIDARSDIYSAGVVLYEMLTGRLPFEGDSAVSVAIQHLSSVPLAPRDIDPSIPEPLELICMKAMNSDPNKRYASADAMIEDLEKFRRDPSVDMDYIRQELTTPAPDTEPTMPLPTAQVASAVKKHTGELRREREQEEEPPHRDRHHRGHFCCGGAAGGAAVQADPGRFRPGGQQQELSRARRPWQDCGGGPGAGGRQGHLPDRGAGYPDHRYV